MNILNSQDFLSNCKSEKYNKVFAFRKFEESDVKPMYIIDCDNTYSYVMKGMHFNKSGQLLIETNIGSMPLSCYRDIKVSQTGEYSGYTDAYIKGVRLGGGIDGDEDRVKLRLLKHIVEKLENECDVPHQKYSVSTLSNVSVFKSIQVDLCKYAFELKSKFEQLHPEKKTLSSILKPSIILEEQRLIDCSRDFRSILNELYDSNEYIDSHTPFINAITDKSILQIICDIENQKNNIRIVELHQNAYDTLLTWLPVTCNFIEGTNVDISKYISGYKAGLYCIGILKEEK
ncbi:MAG: hypothetical protein IJ341_02750 [Bacteroidales bacterium]|nr:hypothetical protein [Bacteroidales bacterium]